MNEFGLASPLESIDVPFWGIVVKSTMAIALTVLACKFLGRQSAAMRHRVWVFGLAASLVLPMAALVLPQIMLPVLPSAWNQSARSPAEDSSAAARTNAAKSFRPRFAGRLAGDGVAPPPESDSKAGAAVGAESSQTFDRTDELSPAPSGSPGIQQMFVLAWLLGTVIGASLLMISLARQSIALRRLRRIDDDEWLNSVTAAATAIAMRRSIVTLESDAACVPAAVGVLWPHLVVPSNWRTWSQTQRHCILLHELAHVKRRDVVTQLLGRLALVVHWFNPLVWHAVRQLRVERELASDDCVLLAGQAPSDYAEQLVHTLRCYRPARPAMGVAMAQTARLDQRVLAILDPKRRRDPVGMRYAIILMIFAGAIVGMLGGVTLSTAPAVANPPAEPKIASGAAVENKGAMWKETCAVEYPGSLPVSVAFSADGKTLLTGDTAGEIMALIFADHEPQWRWKSKVGGSHAAVAFSADQKKIYATTEDGIRILDASTGNEAARIEVKGSNSTAMGVFPNKTIADNVASTKIVFGTPRGYFVKTWVEGKLAGTIETSTVAKDAKPADESAVPLAVDPKGRSAIMTGPVDTTGKVGGVKGKNVLWAYVCGDYDAGSPGNRVLSGHTATVISAAWAREGGTAVTGDAAGRVIVWDAKTMKETRRLELGDRVAALAISDDGTHTAAYVLGKQGEVYVWETAKPFEAMKPIHTELGDFGGPQAYASLSFSPDGKQLAGCASDKRRLARLGELIGKVRVWDLSADPKAQLPPKQSYVKSLPKGSSINFVVLNNNSILTAAAKEGAVDFRRVADGEIQVRIVLGTFSIGRMQLSTDRRWLAIEQHAFTKDAGRRVPDTTFDVGVYEVFLKPKTTIPACRQLLDIVSGGKVVAVVREKQIELWDTETAKKLKTAPFQHTQIDAASFSPDGRLLAISDHSELVLWKWEQDAHDRIDLGRRVGSLAFSPNGRFLAEGPTPHESIRIRDLETRQVVQTLTNGTNRSMNVPRLAFAQGGRVLIACDNIAFAKEIAVPHRINLWDAADGSLAHQLSIPAGFAQTFDVSPDGRYLIATLVDGDGVKLNGWRLDGEEPVKEPGTNSPAAVAPH